MVYHRVDVLNAPSMTFSLIVPLIFSSRSPHYLIYPSHQVRRSRENKRRREQQPQVAELTRVLPMAGPACDQPSCDQPSCEHMRESVTFLQRLQQMLSKFYFNAALLTPAEREEVHQYLALPKG